MFRPHYVTWSEQQKIEYNAMPHLRNAIRIIAETGLRVKKELLPMKKSQIDFLNMVLWIPDSKTPNGVAEIPLTKIALEAFQNQLAISVFPSDLNKKGHLRSIRTAWKKALKRAEIPYFRVGHPVASTGRLSGVQKIFPNGVADEERSARQNQSPSQ
jgi:integrase